MELSSDLPQVHGIGRSPHLRATGPRQALPCRVLRCPESSAVQAAQPRRERGKLGRGDGGAAVVAIAA